VLRVDVRKGIKEMTMTTAAEAAAAAAAAICALRCAAATRRLNDDG
jgi:hypothetical protein